MAVFENQKILLDTNIWRYLIDANASGKLFSSLKTSSNKIQVSPACLYETLRMKDARTIKNKVQENHRVITQIANNTREQALLGDFPKAVEEAILNSNEAQQKQMMKLLSMEDKFGQFMNTIYDMMQKDAGK